MLRLGLDAARPAHLMPGLTVQLTNDICLLPRDTNQVRPPPLAPLGQRLPRTSGVEGRIPGPSAPNGHG